MVTVEYPLVESPARQEFHDVHWADGVDPLTKVSEYVSHPPPDVNSLWITTGAAVLVWLTTTVSEVV
jgi:hypothetical protein